jgi:hypothetical protein
MRISRITSLPSSKHTHHVNDLNICGTGKITTPTMWNGRSMMVASLRILTADRAA